MAEAMQGFCKQVMPARCKLLEEASRICGNILEYLREPKHSMIGPDKSSDNHAVVAFSTWNSV